jgi:eukaryotic-like serine/threonine-protein kinase
MPDRDADNGATVSRKTPLPDTDVPTVDINEVRPPIQHPRGPSAASFAPDDVAAGRFRIIRFLARGGMGEVYEAEDLELKERVALKTVRLEIAHDEHSLDRFRREIQLARKVTHPNVCRTFDVFHHVETRNDRSTRETLVVSMELLGGETLEQHIKKSGRFSIDAALPIIVQMVAGLHAAHQEGIIHRDFKSSNVLLAPRKSGSGGVRAVITDFGLARAESSRGQSLTGLNEFVGTPAYMAPEQLQGGEITPRTDIYALGVVWFEMVTGELPFVEDSGLATALKRLKEPAPSPRKFVPDLDSKSEQAILRCLEIKPANRYADTEELLQTLSGTIPLTGRLPLVLRRRRLLTICIVLVLLIGIVIGYIGMRYRFQVSSKSRPSIAVLGFRNMSAEKESVVSGEELAEDLRSQLDTGLVHIVSPAKVDEIKHEMVPNDDGSLRLADLRKLHDLLDCDYVVTGSYGVEGNEGQREIVWNIHVDRTQDGERQGTVIERKPVSKWSPDVVTNAGIEVQGKLNIAVPASEVARLHGRLPADVRASDDLAQGRQKLADFDVHSAIALFEKAVSEDSKHAQAHSELADVWWELGYEDKARNEAKTALELAPGLSRDTHDLIQARYYEMNHNWDSAIALYSSLWNDPATREPDYGLLLARSQINAGKAQDGLRTLDELRKTDPVPGIQAQADLAEADAQEAQAAYQAQLDSANAAANAAHNLGAKLLFARSRISQCLAELNLEGPAKADPLCNEARALNESIGDKLGTARAVNAIANALYYKGAYAQASPLYEQALGIARSIGDKFDEGGALNNLALIKSRQGDYKGAAAAYRESIAVARERGDSNALALAQQNLAGTLYQQGDRHGAADMFDAAIKTSHGIGAKDVEARALNNRCMIEEESGELTRALQDCRESLRLRQEAGDKNAIARSLQNTGRIYVYQGNFSQAKQEYHQALSIQQGLSAKSDAAYTQLLLSKVAVLEGRADDALTDAKAAASEFAAEKDSDSEAEARTTLAEAQLGSGDISGARAQIEQASKLARQAGDHSLTLEAEIVAARIDARIGNAESAVQTLRKVQKQAVAAGLVAVEFEGRLALGESEINAGHAEEGRATLHALSLAAKAKGFGYISAAARKAG